MGSPVPVPAALQRDVIFFVTADGVLEAKTDAEGIVKEAYLRALSRPPTENELEKLTAVLSEASDDAERRQLLEDLYWSVLSSREFLFNH